MKTLSLTLLLFCALPKATQASPKPGDKIADLYSEEKRYTSCKLIKIEPDGITISHSEGMAKLYFSKLPKNIQETYSFDPAEAEKHAENTKLSQKRRQDIPTKKDVAHSPATLTFPTPRPHGAGTPSRARLDAMLAERRQAEQEERVRREEANERTKERAEEKKLKKPKKKQ